MNNQEQANTNDPLGIIGRKMKGFKFDGFKYNYLNYHLNMNKHIGNEGEIVSYMEEYDCYYCKFSDREWAYPAKLIMQHIVDTPQELTLLEKFEQGWEIDRDGVKAVDVRMSKTWGGKVVVEWSNCVVGIYDNSANLFKCTPPKERKTVYVYLLTITGKCLTSEELLTSEFCKIIQTIHIEQNVEEWEVVNP